MSGIFSSDNSHSRSFKSAVATILLKHLVPICWRQRSFRLGNEDSKSIKDQNGAQNVVPFWGHEVARVGGAGGLQGKKKITIIVCIPPAVQEWLQKSLLLGWAHMVWATLPIPFVSSESGTHTVSVLAQHATLGKRKKREKVGQCQLGGASSCKAAPKGEAPSIA